MSDLARTIITDIANLADAVAMSVLNGQAQATFTGRATSDCPSGTVATVCIASGWMDEVVIAAYEADPRFYVSESVGRSWRNALGEYPVELGGPLCELP